MSQSLSTATGGFCTCHDHLQGGLSYSQRGRRLLLVIALNVGIPVAQCVGGIYAKSTAIISDAIHNMGDVLTLVIAYLALCAARKAPTCTHTFGYKRSEIIAAFFNALVVIGASLVIVKEAVERLVYPESILGGWVVGLAVLGVVGNGLSAWLLHDDAAHNLNTRSAFLHLLGDFLTSIAVLVGGVVLLFRPWWWLDPLLSLLIVIFIVKSCWGVLRDTTRILMEAAPAGVDLSKVKEAIEGISGVRGAHYLHAWTLDPRSTAFSCHVVVEDQPLSRLEQVRSTIQQVLFREFNINHPVLQFETVPCGSGGILCELACREGERSSAGGGNSGSPPTPPLGRPAASRSDVLWTTGWWRILLSATRMCFGGVFVYASVGKILHPKSFAEVVFNYQLLPDMLINAVAVILPWVEVVAGIAVVTGWWLFGGLAVVNGLLGIFTIALLLNIARGVDVSCGCFSTEVTEVSRLEMWLDVVRDVVLLGVGLFLTVTYGRVRGVVSGTSKTGER